VGHERTEAATLIEGLREPLQAALGKVEIGELQHLPGPNRVVDETTKVLVKDPRGQPVSFVLISPSVDPEIIARGMQLAAESKLRLGPWAGRVIFDPILEGRLGGLSYAALPYYRPITGGRLRRRFFQMVLRPGLLDWVAAVVEATAEPAAVDIVNESFELPLAHLAESLLVEPAMRRAAEVSLGRLQEAAWRPRHCLMHGDLWQGNILSAPAIVDGKRLRPRDRFFIIDWPGAVPRGYPMFDLARLLMALRVGRTTASVQVARHCRILECEQIDALSHLLAALGSIGMKLGHFPPENYAQMSNHCFSTVSRAIGLT
tara:strand:+ start:1516 stop:2466 length:951 start_codon:yes stop_codon:yes gene_type:complete